MVVNIAVAHSLRARSTEWFIEPVAVVAPRAHAFRGIRSACGRYLWTAAWRVPADGLLADVDRCQGCVDAVGLSPLEERSLDGDR